MTSTARRADEFDLPEETELRRNPAVNLHLLEQAEQLLAKLDQLDIGEPKREELAMPGPFDDGPVRLLESWNQRRSLSCYSRS
jgi:hypothetical protein